MDIQLLEQQLAGLEARGKELRDDEALFLKAQGLREQEEEARGKIVTLEGDLQGLKEEITDLETERNEKASEICSPIKKAINKLLPTGMAVLDIGPDGSFFIGWEIDGTVRPYKGLSGGEVVSFNLALSNAIGAGILLVESAELDNLRMSAQLKAIGKYDGQVIVSTCHAPETIPDDWKVVRL